MHMIDAVEFKIRSGVRPWWVIDPRQSRVLQSWDFVIMSALLFTALVTPVEVSFMPPPESADDSLFLFNRLIDVIFIADLALQFVLMYPEESREGARWVFSPQRIWRHYILGWFTLDAVSILVSAFDFVAISAASANAGASDSLLNATGVGSGLGVDTAYLDTVVKLKALRILRALRLIKLMRLARMSRIFVRDRQLEHARGPNACCGVYACRFAALLPSRRNTDAYVCVRARGCVWSCGEQKRYESRVAINYAAAALLKVLLVTAMWAHLCACLWTLQADLFHDTRAETWLGKELCFSLDVGGGRLIDVCEPPGEIYVASLYWCVPTLLDIPWARGKPSDLPP